MIVIEFLAGTAKGLVVDGSQLPIRIGRAPSNQLVLPDYHLSGEHGEVYRDGDSYVFRDFRSTNGSRVLRGGVTIPIDAACQWELTLQHSDELQLGDAQNPVRAAIRLFSVARESEGDLGDRLIASRSIVDLPVVADRVEHNPALAARLYKALQPLTTRLDIGGCADAILDAAFQLMATATHAAVLLRSESDTDRFTVIAARTRGGEVTGAQGVRASRAVLKQMLADRAAVLAADAQEVLGTSESILGGKIDSTLALPLWRGDEIRGLIQVDNRAEGRMFNESDLECGLLLGAQAALAIENAALVSRLKIAEERLRGENTYLKSKEERSAAATIIGASAALRQVLAQIERVVDTRATVCIEGETGTGKELFASAIHYQSRRKEHLFVAQNCAALPENLLESELFGHRRGSFTGADADKKGLFEIADRGTLFLDEVGEMPLSLQAKLLRVLQEGTIRAVGATQERAVDVRIICATNRDLAKEVERGAFRQDLYYRLMVFPLRLPPLRERKDDIPLLLQHFLRKYSAEYRVPIAGLAQETIEALQLYPWPGNVRELENEIQRLVIQAEPHSWLQPAELSPRIWQGPNAKDAAALAARGTLRDMMMQIERRLVQQALHEAHGNKTRAAQQLGITREGLHKKLGKLGIDE